MDRMKTFGLYALCVILFFIFSNVMINIAIKTAYEPIDSEIIVRNNLKLDVTDVKATYVNGYVEGNLKNTGNDIQKTYVKIDLYSKRDTLLGTKYVIIDNLKQDETRDFRMAFKFTDVDHCKVDVVNEIQEENVTEEQFTSTEMKFAGIITAVIFLCYFA